MKVKVQLEQDEDGVWVATVPNLPGCISQGSTKTEARRNIREAIELHISALARDGIIVPKGSRLVELEVSVKS